MTDREKSQAQLRLRVRHLIELLLGASLGLVDEGLAEGKTEFEVVNAVMNELNGAGVVAVDMKELEEKLKEAKGEAGRILSSDEELN